MSTLSSSEEEVEVGREPNQVETARRQLGVLKLGGGGKTTSVQKKKQQKKQKKRRNKGKSRSGHSRRKKKVIQNEQMNALQLFVDTSEDEQSALIQWRAIHAAAQLVANLLKEGKTLQYKEGSGNTDLVYNLQTLFGIPMVSSGPLPLFQWIDGLVGMGGQQHVTDYDKHYYKAPMYTEEDVHPYIDRIEALYKIVDDEDQTKPLTELDVIVTFTMMCGYVIQLMRDNIMPTYCKQVMGDVTEVLDREAPGIESAFREPSQ